jgi:hypothetical protein
VKVHDARDGFNDLKPEFLSGGQFPWIWILVGLVVVLLFIKLRKGKVKEIVPARKSLSDYLSELESLKLKINTGVEAPKILSAEGSLILRRFLFDRTKVSILESTPQESEKLLENNGRFSQETSKEIAKLLLQLESISFSEQKGEVDAIQSKALQLLNHCALILQKVETGLPGDLV